MRFSTFANHLHKLEGTSSRLTITAELAELYQALAPAEVAPASYLLQGQLRPSFDSLEFQLSQKMVLRALGSLVSQTTGGGENLFGEADQTASEDHVKKLFHSSGDLGDVAGQVVTKDSSNLTVETVYDRLVAIAQMSGAGSQEQKLIGLSQLLVELDSVGAKYVIRILLGKLRLGFATMTMLDALSWATTGGKTESGLLEEAYNKRADIGQLAAAYLSATTAEARQQALAHYSVKLGVPVLPALCQRLDSAAEMIAKMGEVMVEPKYDGVRVQVHFDRQAPQQIKTFTRSLEENSHQFPELSQIAKHLDCQNCILDGEAIGFDRETGKLRPFQDTITRKRKHGIDETAAAIPLKFFFFDVLFLDNSPLIAKPLRERKEILNKLFKDSEHFVHTPVLVTQDPEKLHHLHEQLLTEGLEGVVVKQVDSPYSSGRKGWQWVKMKEAEGSRGKLKDTLDCIVMGYYRGQGKRNSFGIGAFLVGVLDDSGQVKTIAKIGTGLSDDQFRELKHRADKLKTIDPVASYEVAKGLTPDVWVKPGLVVEIAADELTNSPQHSAGLALRFPRLVQFRDDKEWSQATKVSELEGIK